MSQTARALSALAIVCLGSTLLTTTPAAQADRGATSPIVVRGALPDGLPALTLDAYALEDSAGEQPGDALSRTLVTSTLDQGSNTYAVHVDPSELPQHAVDRGGVVDFELRFSSETESWVTFTSARLVSNQASGRVEWVDPVEAVADTSAEVARIAGGEQVRIPAVAQRKGLAVSRLRAKDLAPVDLASTQRARRAPCDWIYQYDSNRSTTISTSYPVGATDSWLDVSRSEGGTFGVAYNNGNGFYASGSKFAEGGWGATWGKSSDMRSYRIQTNYHFYKGGCGGQKWAPHIETGGATSNYDGLSRPSWNTYCANVANDVVWRRWDSSGSSYSLGTAVKFSSAIGIDLSGTKNYSSSHTLYYHIQGSNPKKLCGSNDYPAKAGKIIERLR